jgi:glycine/D-amino acid oxidase-like deaminating enzyme
MAPSRGTVNDRIETLIVGGGISGLACARTLHNAGRAFLVVTDRLGGRTYHSADGSMNFGATYLNADYRHVSRYVGRGLPFQLRAACGHPAEGPRPLLHWRNLGRLRPVARLVLRLHELRLALRAFRKASEQTPQYLLAPHFPLIDRYRRQSAAELIAELDLGSAHEDFFRLAFMATCFTDPSEANALYYLGTLFPIIVPTWVADFRLTYARLTSGFTEKLLFDRVQALDRLRDGSWAVVTEAGRTFRANNVVLAAPYHNLTSLYPVPVPGLAVPATVLHIRGERQPAFHGKSFLLLRPEETGVALMWRQRGGRDLVFSVRPGPDLARVYRKPEVVASVSWKTAVVLSHGEWAPLVLEPGLYLVGDYNLCGMEDSFLTGMCAARHILRSTCGHAS